MVWVFNFHTLYLHKGNFLLMQLRLLTFVIKTQSDYIYISGERINRGKFMISYSIHPYPLTPYMIGMLKVCTSWILNFNAAPTVAQNSTECSGRKHGQTNA